MLLPPNEEHDGLVFSYRGGGAVEEILSGEDAEDDLDDEEWMGRAHELFGGDSDEETPDVESGSQVDRSVGEEMEYYRSAGRGDGDARRDPRPWRRRRFALKSRRRVIRGPGEPTKAQQEAHELSHQPPEDWCEFCVRARCVESPLRGAHPEGRT